jgi:NAD(P)-dependent dehydrogenase (short-subunit alcohol dehydrogenase family)
MTRPLVGRVAIVTGASRGIGKGCALELAAAGATVYVTGRSVREGDAALPGTVGATAAEIAAEGGSAVAVACDHRDDGAVETLFARVDAEQGRLDVLVNNAFLIPPELTSGKRFFELPISNWDDMIDVGTRSAYVASAFAARRMVERKAGLIANISSSGAAKYAWHVAYGVGKAALDRLTADVAHELRELGVCAVSLWPGFVLTERIEKYRAQLPGLARVKPESQRFTGRAVAALAADPDVMRHSGRALASRDLALLYGFRDLDGSLPDGPLEHRSTS